MFNIEKEIKDNLPYFNDKEPDLGHKNRFAKRLNESLVSKPKRYRTQLVFKVAAALLLLITTSLLIKTLVFNNDIEKLTITQIEYSDELYQVQNYYDELALLSFNKIDEFAKSDEEAQKLKNITQRRMDKLDANLAMIEKEYVKNPQCEKLKAAIVVNKKKKVEVVNNIVEQLNNAQQGYHVGSMFTNY